MSNLILSKEPFMKKYLAILLGAFCLATACTETTEGFLDSKGKETEDLESVLADSVKTMGFHAALYWQISRLAMSPHSYNISSLYNFKDYEAGTDNSRYDGYFKVTEFTPAYTKGDFSQGGTNAGFNDFQIGWTEPFQTIYRCNSFLENYENSVLTAPTKKRLADEARFLRAFFYFHLLRQYGAFPIVDHVIDPYAPEQRPRNTFEECVDFIAGDLEYCAENLPLIQDGVDYGRATQGAALGVLTELYALAASPLYNGGNIGSGDNRLLVGYDDYNVNRWQRVVNAAERLFGLGVYDLVVDNETRPGNGFYLATTKRKSEERVWAWLTVTTSFFHKPSLPQSRGGSHQIVPYHELVEAFPMKNGKAISEAGSGYDEDHPYDNRDPRMGYTIIYNEAEWIKVKNGKKEPVYTYRDATDDGYGTPKGSSTGYYFRKCSNESYLGGDNDPEGQGLSFIRYADILLLYAEALTELNVDKNRDVIEKQLFKIRSRAGIDAGDDERYGVPANMNREQMIEFIINERRIEFANECGNRFWDLKRRKMYERLDGVWTSAAVWEKIGDGQYTWSVVPIEQHFFQQRMYFSAIPQREINASHGKLIQNPGW